MLAPYFKDSLHCTASEKKKRTLSSKAAPLSACSELAERLSVTVNVVHSAQTKARFEYSTLHRQGQEFGYSAHFTDTGKNLDMEYIVQTRVIINLICSQGCVYFEACI